jgi:hypothetical protein
MFIEFVICIKRMDIWQLFDGASLGTVIVLQDDQIKFLKLLKDFRGERLRGKLVPLKPGAKLMEVIGKCRDIMTHARKVVRCDVEDEAIADPLRANNCNFFNLSFGFFRRKIQEDSETFFISGVAGKGVSPPLPRRRREKWPEDLEYPTDKSETEVFNHNT